MSQCLCGAPDCRSCGPAQGWHVHSRHCAGEDGRYECGQLAYGDQEMSCGYCGNPADGDICSNCQRCIEEEEHA
jgi:hypothetical protein